MTIRETPSLRREPLPPALRLLLLLFVASITFSLTGTALIRVFPGVLSVFGPYFVQLVKIPTWMYMATLPIIVWLMYSRTLNPARLGLVALWGIMIGGAAEMLGTTTGYPFGGYVYGEWLGPKLAGHVPYFIPPSWFAMSLVSYDLASRISDRATRRVALAALFMTLWDVSLDPAMSRAFPFWSYEADGFFYGMPISNWIGWLAVSWVIAVGIELVVQGKPAHSRLASTFYALNCLFPLMLSFIYGLYGAVLAGAVATGAVLLWVRRSDPMNQADVESGDRIRLGENVSGGATTYSRV